jgi:peptide/nickel transport system ATP-binding protein
MDSAIQPVNIHSGCRFIRCNHDTLLQVTDLKVHFPIRKGLFKRVAGHVKAVDGVSLKIAAGKTLALVGESGCGKTTIGKSILQLIQPTAGSVRFKDQELSGLRRSQLRPIRSQFQIIFQDPYASLNPRMRIIEILQEGMDALNIGAPDHSDSKPLASAHTREQEIDALLQRVGLPADVKWRFPHEFSGGQRQRIAIARALAVNPKLLICDEPTSALDVSVQAQILNLLKSLQNNLGLAFLFITHNIAVVEYLADEVAVMYLGRIVERGLIDEVIGNPKTPVHAGVTVVGSADQAQSGGNRSSISKETCLRRLRHPPVAIFIPVARKQCRFAGNPTRRSVHSVQRIPYIVIFIHRNKNSANYEH